MRRRVLHIQIELENAAFADDITGEIGRCLERAWGMVPQLEGEEPRFIYDTNGNKVGHVYIQRSAEDLSAEDEDE
ncbi:MAG: hypothetical protein ACOVKC_00285 [Brevundimonas sp.]